LGKRSDFKRVEKDFYETIDIKAVQPLSDLGGCSYYEPCVGERSLVRLLDTIGLDCVGSSDDEIDARTITKEQVGECDYIITNPPWTRKLLHPMIENLSMIKPTWLLFDSSWVYTKQARGLSKKYLKEIRPIGRLRWIEGTKMSSKDDCSWYLFDVNKDVDYIEFVITGE